MWKRALVTKESIANSEDRTQYFLASRLFKKLEPVHGLDLSITHVVMVLPHVREVLTLFHGKLYQHNNSTEAGSMLLNAVSEDNIKALIVLKVLVDFFMSHP